MNSLQKKPIFLLPIRCLHCVSLCCVLLLAGCVSLGPFRNPEVRQLSRSALYPPFATGTLQRMDLSVDVAGRHFSGLLLLKPLSDTTFRVVYTSYAGPTLFDMQVSPSGYQVHQCMEELNKKKILGLFARMLSELLLISVPDTFQGGVCSEMVIQGVAKEGTGAVQTAVGHSMIRTGSGGQKTYYWVDQQQQELHAIRIPGFLSGWRFQLLTSEDGLLERVDVRFQSLVGVRMVLTRVAP